MDRFAGPSGASLEPVPAGAPPWSHHCGGTLDGIVPRLDHIAGLGADAIYLTPIFRAGSNHKYDTADFREVDPRFGGDGAFERLAASCRARGMGLILDAVFNHVGREHAWFKAALADPDAAERRFFRWTSPTEYECWRGHKSLPELNLSDESVRHYLITGPESVSRWWLRRGATGWRVDCANDVGPECCSLLTQVAREEAALDGVTGELWNFADAWLASGALDGVMNYYFRETVLTLVRGEIAPAQAAFNLKRMARAYPTRALQCSWNMLSSHDTPRLIHVIPDSSRRLFAWVLAFACPGVPLVYYGEETGMDGSQDPDNRRPMNWDEGGWDTVTLDLIRRLAALRRDHPALRAGGYLPLPQPGVPALLAFARTRPWPGETVFVLANASDEPLRTRAFIPYAWLHDAAPLRDLLGAAPATRAASGSIPLELPPWGIALYQADDTAIPNYRFFKHRAPEGQLPS
ncbi:MAG: glycoside hydrolase family 13 protein [Candidatus Sumerlaeaceae bacterium]|nr:glycoside hydrolase family 13 protein [Candidatus Sumerlaeaceae bacterium]